MATAATAAATRAEAREQVREVHVLEGELLIAAGCWRVQSGGGRNSSPCGRAAQRVVGRAFLRVLESLVGLGNFLEARLGLRLLGNIRMIFLRQSAICLLDLVGGGAALDAECGVVVAVLHRARY